VKRKQIRFIKRFGIGISLLTLVLGCAYSFRSPSALQGKAIAIPPFESKTTRYGVRDELTQAVIQAFRDDNRLKVTDPAKADLLLLGTLTDYRKEPFTYDRQEQLLNYKVRLFVDYSLKDAKSDSILWSVKGYEGWATYGVSLVDSEQVGIQAAIQNLSRDIVRRTVEAW
jgi:hypothetical protein